MQEYTKDGLIPLADAYTAYKNLSSAGYADDQTQSVLQNLKDSAAFARQGSLTMGEAVKSATEMHKNENSILVDNAGVTKNLSVIWEEYAASIGKGVGSLTAAEKRHCHGRRSHAGNRVPDRRRGPLCLNFRRRAGGR